MYLPSRPAMEIMCFQMPCGVSSTNVETLQSVPSTSRPESQLIKRDESRSVEVKKVKLLKCDSGDRAEDVSDILY